MIIDGISTDIAVNLTGKKVTIKERWKYEPLTFATPSSTNEWTDVSIEVYPNPAYDLLNIQIKEMQTYQDLSASIINADGKIMTEQGIQKDINNIDISTLVSGVYTVKVMENKQIVFVSKFIKIQ